jgi:hypothetical protein
MMWKNVVEAERSQMTIWQMRIACWIPEATNTLSGFYCFFAVTMVK